MKITKRQLRRIIKEEKARLLNEVTPEDRAMAATYDEIDQMTRNHLGAKIEEAIALAQEAQAPGVVAALIEAYEALQEW